ncbi:MAG: hypothetical protein QM811_01900 [Pirellulales bacterium]
MFASLSSTPFSNTNVGTTRCQGLASSEAEKSSVKSCSRLTAIDSAGILGGSAAKETAFKHNSAVANMM